MAEVWFNSTSACSDSSAEHELCDNQRLQQPDLAARRGAGGDCVENVQSCTPRGMLRVAWGYSWVLGYTVPSGCTAWGQTDSRKSCVQQGLTASLWS